MSQFESQFDCILIGTGNSGKAAADALKEKGKNALYIELKPEMVATLISQQAVGQSTGSSNPSSQTETHGNGEIFVQKQTLHTNQLETNTYTFQSKPAEDFSYQTDSFYDESSQADQSSSAKDMEIIEAQKVEYAPPHYSFFTNRGPLRKKTLRRKQKLNFQETPETGDDYPVYHLERVQLGEEEESSNHMEDPWNPPFIDEDQEKQEEMYLEREQKLRKKRTNNQWIHSFNQDDEESPMQTDRSSFSPATYGPSDNPFSSDSFPDFYSNGFQAESDKNLPSDYYKPNEQNKDNPSNELVPFEPFSPRRRVRQGKRSRLQKKRGALAEKTNQSLTENHQQQENQSMLFSGEPAVHEKNPIFPDGSSGVQSFGNEEKIEAQQPFSAFQTNESNESASSLKRDDIEFEDAYGGYSSWEEIMTPYSQNSRKRQEIDKIEKRKIALRGLHNLINNMG